MRNGFGGMERDERAKNADIRVRRHILSHHEAFHLHGSVSLVMMAVRREGI